MNREVMALLFLLATSASNEQLAGEGKIRQDASVKTSVEITIHAPAERVWRVLTDVNDWPKWQPDISATDIHGPLEAGTTFSWTTGGTHIKSRIALVEPDAQFAWTGKAYRVQAIHVWKLQRLSDDRTLVKTEESMNGFLLTLFYSSKKLEETDRRWLDRLKAASE
jgi:uncharacterized protein YndB with AHSA1/START domain